MDRVPGLALTAQVYALANQENRVLNMTNAAKAERENKKTAGKSLDDGAVEAVIQSGMAPLFGTMEG